MFANLSRTGPATLACVVKHFVNGLQHLVFAPPLVNILMERPRAVGEQEQTHQEMLPAGETSAEMHSARIIPGS